MSDSKLPTNPYAKGIRKKQTEKENMGRQSQQRMSNTKRAYQLAGSSSARTSKGSKQRTLFGADAFDPSKDCQICHAKLMQKLNPSYRIPHRDHHVMCIHNTKTKGLGEVSRQTMACRHDEKRLKVLFETPLEDKEKGSAKYLTKEAVNKFFEPRSNQKKAAPTLKSTQPKLTTKTPPNNSLDFAKGVIEKTTDKKFQEEHKNKMAPLAILAFADVVVKNVIQTGKFDSFFDGIALKVPECGDSESGVNPHYHSIVGQTLYLVDWKRAFNIDVPCPDTTSCTGTLHNDRTNFSKGKTLFPIFNVEGAPSWCMVMKLECSCCRRKFRANDAQVLLSLPAYVAASYPVDIKYALPNKQCHLHRSATEIFDSIMLTYGNGELCSRLLYNAINRSYIGKLKSYYSYISHRGLRDKCRPYLDKDDEYVKQHPPLGDTVRNIYDEAASSSWNEWGISDHDRNTREIQAVECNGGIFAQDHTFEVVKNYQQKEGTTKAAWDVATGTGEIACVALVPTTKARHFSHAARSLLSRPHFNPSVMYSDTWPNGKGFWGKLTTAEGRLGLFHFEKRITRTLRKKHVDHNSAVTDLLDALYSYHEGDYDKLLTALKTGMLSAGTGDQPLTSHAINQMKSTKLFRQRYGKYLRKMLRPAATMAQKLDDWFCKYKVTSSNPGLSPAFGRLDPHHQIPLFTSETKAAVEECKIKAQYLPDALPIEQMYDTIPPHPNSKHQLPEYLSHRGESKLEAFHDRLANFANSGMRDSLADNLHLMGTARYNLGIRHKRSLLRTNKQQRCKIPAGWEKVVPFTNHSELGYVNQLAAEAGAPPPFPNAEKLPPDNGERFFSEYLAVVNPEKASYGDGEFCLCDVCCTSGVPMQEERGRNDARKTPQENPPLEAAAECVSNPTAIVAAKQVPHRQQSNKVSMPVRCPPSLFTAPVLSCGPTVAPMMVMSAFHQQHQLPRYHHYYPSGAPQPPMTAMIPPIQVPDYYYASACCHKYSRWLAKRTGRPPHDVDCPARQQQLLLQQQQHHINKKPWV